MRPKEEQKDEIDEFVRCAPFQSRYPEFRQAWIQNDGMMLDGRYSYYRQEVRELGKEFRDLRNSKWFA